MTVKQNNAHVVELLSMKFILKKKNYIYFEPSIIAIRRFLVIAFNDTEFQQQNQYEENLLSKIHKNTIRFSKIILGLQCCL